jgi:glycerol-3-phosphate O-acyltransferase
MRVEDRERVIEEVVSRVVQEKIEAAFRTKSSLETIINDTIYHERRRLESGKLNKKEKQDLLYWKKINKRFLNASEEEQKKILKEIVTGFTQEIMGYFNPRVYRVVTKLVPWGVSLLLGLLHPALWWSTFPKLAKLSERIVIQGEVKLLQALDKIGTVILVPTHSTHMDSLAAGFALHQLGLPPYTYGAGLNLFTNNLISYFMQNLGAYKVDRKKTAGLYKDVLKEYATITLELGYDNLFFPGGTRIRTGAVETHLKLGLLGTGLSAYINNVKHQKQDPNIFVVPCTLSYPLVLEAATLIDDFLKETGKSRYIIEDDEFTQPRRILSYLHALTHLHSHIYVTIAPAMDLFGNCVDMQGVPYDKRGRPLDISRYVMVAGKVEHDVQRDSVYTRELSQEILQAFHKHNVAMCTHIVAFVVHQLLSKNNPEMDLYRLLRTGGKEENLPLRDICEAVERVLGQLQKLAAQGEIRLDAKLQGKGVEAIVDCALAHFAAYHTKPVMFRRGDRIYPNDHNLLYYYHNRLQNYGLEKCV